MTDKQKRFITEYLVDLSATQAAIRAGYLTPELISEVRDWCYLKRISAVSYITGLIEADLHSNEKQEKLAVFRRLSDEA